MDNKIKTLLIYVSITFSITYLLCNIGSIIIELIYSIKNGEFVIYFKAGWLFQTIRIIMSIIILIVALFMEKYIKVKNIAKYKILNVLFYIIFTISILLFVLMFHYILSNPDFISEIQTIPFGRIHYILIACYVLLTVPLIGMLMALLILLINYRMSKNNNIKTI